MYLVSVVDRFIGWSHSRLVCWLIDRSFIRRGDSRLFRLDDIGLGLVSKVRSG